MNAPTTRHDTVTISAEEYAELRRKALAWDAAHRLVGAALASCMTGTRRTWDRTLNAARTRLFRLVLVDNGRLEPVEREGR